MNYNVENYNNEGVNMYIYELHSHTSEVSKCSKITGADLAVFYKNRGFAGLFITDHFLNGNTVISRELPWEERIAQFYRGYENAYKKGLEIGLDVFFGWEYSYRGTDFLTYGLDRDWLLNHPEVMEISVNEYCDLVHENGGFIIQAHPFREAFYIDMIRLLPRKVDAVEVLNASMIDFVNDRANEYADNYGLLKTAGSDNHWGPMEKLGAMGVPERLSDEMEMMEAIRNGQARIVLL
jgi:predicted metal-dependent phosphoesterase TrpH